jgi:predicted RNase H-like HicB family nuclease
MTDIRRIHATFDPESSVWWAESDDLPGLVTEAATFDALVERVAAVAPELLATNGQIPAGPVTLEFLATRQVQMA